MLNNNGVNNGHITRKQTFSRPFKFINLELSCYLTTVKPMFHGHSIGLSPVCRLPPGVDLLRLTRDDLIQICGLADGIRLNNALQSK